MCVCVCAYTSEGSCDNMRNAAHSGTSRMRGVMYSEWRIPREYLGALLLFTLTCSGVYAPGPGVLWESAEGGRGLHVTPLYSWTESPVTDGAAMSQIDIPGCYPQVVGMSEAGLPW